MDLYKVQNDGPTGATIGSLAILHNGSFYGNATGKLVDAVQMGATHVLAYSGELGEAKLKGAARKVIAGSVAPVTQAAPVAAPVAPSAKRRTWLGFCKEFDVTGKLADQDVDTQHAWEAYKTGDDAEAASPVTNVAPVIIGTPSVPGLAKLTVAQLEALAAKILGELARRAS